MTAAHGTGTPVVLYSCLTQHGDTEGILDGLRTAAISRGWEVVGEFADRTGVAAPEAERPQLRMAKAIIAAGQATILVTRYPSMVAVFTDGSETLGTWLARHGATVHCTWKPARVAVP